MKKAKRVCSLFLCLLMIISIMPVAEISVLAVSQYTVCPSGTISWATIYEAQVANADSYYWKHDGEYCKLTAEQVGSAKYVTLWRSDKDEKRYLKPHKDDDSSSKYDWGNDRYTGGYLYKQDVGTSGGTALADGTYTAISSGSVADEGEMYKAIVTITVKNGKVTTITAKGPTDPDNLVYFNKALNGIINGFVGQSAIPGAEKTIDSVSGATKSYRVITDAIGNALNGNLYQEETGGGDDTQSGNGLIPDGTYTKTSTTSFKKDSETYYATVTITVTGGVVTSVTASGPTKSSKNISYFNKAINKIKSQLVNETADSSIKSFDSVSGATKSSQLIRNAVQQIVSENITSSSSSTKTYYVLTSTLTSGKKYIIINRNSAGSGVALGSISDSKFSPVTLTVKSADSTISKPYIDMADTDTVYTVTGSFSSFKLKNQSGSFIKINDKKASVTSSESSAIALKYASNKISYYDSSKAETRYIYYKSSKYEWKFESSGTSLYFYEEYTPPAPAKTYTVKFYTYDGELIKSYTAEEGTYPSALLENAYQNPSRDSTDAYDYTFNGWARDMYQTDGTKLSGLPKLTENVSYYQAFVATPRKYAVTWKNWDKTNNNETAVSYIEYGDRPVYPNSGTPEKADDTNYTYTFSGWSTSPNQTQGTAIEDLPDVTEAITYYACFTPNPVMYTITWKNYDGVTLATESVAYGHMPSYTGTTPTKPRQGSTVYTHSGWTPTITPVTGNVTYTATFTESQNSYVLDLGDEVTFNLKTKEFTGASDKSGYEEWQGNTLIWVYPENVVFTVNGVPCSPRKNGYGLRFVSEDENIALFETNLANGDEWFELTGNVGSTIVHAQVFDTTTKETLAQKDITVNVIQPIADGIYGDNSVTVQRYGYTPIVAVNVVDNYIRGIYADAEMEAENQAFFDSALTGIRNQLINQPVTKASQIDTVSGATRTANALIAEIQKGLSEDSKGPYTITWKDYDNSVIATQSDVMYGTRTAYDDDIPIREADADYTYTFDRWNPDLSVFVTENKIYTATYSREQNVYTLDLGDDITLNLNDMTFTGADSLSGYYDYNNDGNDDICVYPKDVVFTVNGKQISARTEGKYGLRFVSEDTTIAENCDNDWWLELTGKQGTTTVHAQVFDIVSGKTLAEKDITVNVTKPILYVNVTWVDGDGNTLKTESVKIGDTPSYSGATPTKTATAQYSYTFKGWDKPLTAVTEDTTYTATFNEILREYTVTWKNQDGTQTINTTTVKYGQKPVHDNPSKDKTTQYTYVFNGWSGEKNQISGTFVEQLPVVTGNITYFAAFTSTVNEYTVTFVDEDGTTVLQESTSYPYGTQAKDIVKPSNPTKTATAQYTYTFDGWTPEIVEVTKDVTYKATYKATVNEYTVTFVDEDGTTVLQESTAYPYGTPAIDIVKPIDPHKNPSAEYTYTFASWTPEVTAVEKDVVYKAVYTESPREYTITFADDKGNVLQSENLVYGTMPEYKGETLVKSADAQYSYTFKGWLPEIVSVCEDVVYTPNFEATVNNYTVTFLNDEGTEISSKSYPYGTKAENIEIPTEFSKENPEVGKTYTFTNWDKTIADVTGNAVYTAVYSSAVNQYTVKFVNDKGTLLSEKVYPYGTKAEDIEIPTGFSKEEPETGTTYTFTGWNHTIADVTEDVTYTATYNNALNEYTVTFVNENGDELQKVTATYGTMPQYSGKTPTKESTAQYSYIFNGWSPKLVAVTEDVTYTATYTEKINSYHVTWKNYDGSIFRVDEVLYGEMPDSLGIKPTREQDKIYDYEFSGWKAENSEETGIFEVTGDVTYIAEYNATQTGYQIFIEDYAKNGVTVEGLVSGEYYRGEVKFTVKSDKVVVFGVDNRNGTYTRMYCQEKEDGQHEFTVTVTDSNVYLVKGFKGDFDCNSKIQLRDVAMLSRYRVGSYTANALNLFMGDIDGNGRIQLRDSTFMSKYRVGSYAMKWDKNS